MTSLRRAFVAVVPPPEVLDAVEAAVGPIRRVAPPRLSWTRRGQWHLTLQFLGAVDDVDVLVDSIAGNLHGCRPVALGLGSAGAFPSVSRASVLWIGLDDGRDELARLAGVVERATEPLGYEPDLREYHPHLTIARSQRPRPLTSVVTALGDGPFGPRWDATEVLLMESDTRFDGAVHKEIAHFPLNG
ncbi:MAG: RNA 2',3'-cyclic phosphodiesterase [Acidimicrobiia bacterium]